MSVFIAPTGRERRPRWFWRWRARRALRYLKPLGYVTDDGLQITREEP